MPNARTITDVSQLGKLELGVTRDGRVILGLGNAKGIDLTNGIMIGKSVTQVVAYSTKNPAVGGGGGGTDLSKLDGVVRVVDGTAMGNADTGDVPEGDNLYYTLPRTVLAGYGASAVGTDAYAITVTGITALVVGDRFSFLADVANTGAATLQVNSLPVVAAAILKQHDTALATGDIEAGQIISVVWDGTYWQMQSQAAQIDHGETVGKSDDDHAQYVLLAGRTPVDSQTGTRIILPAGTTAASTAPLKLTSGPLMTITESGAIEFLTDRYYAGITTAAGVWVSQYPPAQSDTYVKATTKASTSYWPYFATNPTKSLTGSWTGNQWVSLALSITNQRFHIDLGSAKTINRIYYENSHNSGANTLTGVKNFTFWGSNTAGDFADLTYANDGTWVQIDGALQFDQHTASNVVDPKYIAVTNTTAYRYYAFKFATIWGSESNMGIRRIELQSSNDPLVRRHIQLTQLAGLTSTRVPFANAAGELTDDADFTFAANRLTTWLTLPAGTATAATAPLKFTSGGVVLTTPEAGAVEAAGDLLYYTIPTGPTRKTVAWTSSITDALSAIFSISQHYTGFPDRSSTSLGWNDGTATLTLTATADPIWINGVSYTINTLTKAFTGGLGEASGLYWFYITAPGGVPQLNYGTTVTDQFAQCLVATVYWNTTTNTGLIADERHWMGRDKWMHEYLHSTVGARYATGLTGTFGNTTFSITAGEIYDEDVEHQLSSNSPMAYPGTAMTTCKVLYHNGDADWKWDSAQTTPYKITGAGGNLQYNSTNTLSTADANKFVNYFVFATNSPSEPIHIVVGTAQYNNAADASAAAVPSLGALPSAEMKLLYKITYKNDGTPTYQSATDYRSSSNLPIGNFVATDHGSLSGLTDLDHPASAIAPLVTNFGGALSVTDTTVQKALDSLDDHTHAGAGAGKIIYYGKSATGTDAYAITASPTALAYADGMMIMLHVDVQTTGASSLDVDSLGVKAIKRDGGANDTGTQDIVDNEIVMLAYDATGGYFQLLGQWRDR